MALHEQFRGKTDPLSRRRFVTGAGTLAIASVAGCTGVVDRIAEVALGEVNLFNQTDTTVAGSITVTDSTDDTVLSESFELAPSTTGADEDAETEGDDHAAYDDVWNGSGTYGARLELAEAVRDQTTASSPVSIETPDEEMLAVAIGGDDSDDAIDFRVGESLSDFAEE
jgi:hypothetical protein